MAVHLPDTDPIVRYGDERRWAEYEQAFGSAGLEFWRWQEQTADALWDLALRVPPWPPQTPREGAALVGKGLAWLLENPSRHLRPGLATGRIPTGCRAPP